MRDDIRIRKWATPRAEAGVQLVEKAQVKVDLLIDRTIERAIRGLGQSATRLGLARVEDGVSRAIRYATPRELGVPVSLHAVDNAHYEAIGPGICVSTGVAVLRNG